MVCRHAGVTQAAPCWLVVSQGMRFGFVASVNARVAEVGRPLDLGLDSAGRFLYAIDRSAATIAILGVHDDGGLQLIAADGNLFRWVEVSAGRLTRQRAELPCRSTDR